MIASTHSALRRRFHALPAESPADRLLLGEGSLRDYAALAEHHYRSRKPATATRVLVLTDPRPTATDRFTHPLCQHRDLQECRGQVVAVLVESLPSLSCRMRDWAMHDRYRHLRPRERAVLLNREIRCISRVVVEPRWRGLGLAVRLVRHALRTATTPFTEAMAAMARVHPFFEKAGMTAYPRPPLPSHARLLAALHRVNIQPIALSCVSDVQRRIEDLPSTQQAWIANEIHCWFRQTVGRSARQDTALVDQLAAAHESLTLEPIYHLHDNREPADVD
jgi:GNAT superfamily N-acetyltransferase